MEFYKTQIPVYFAVHGFADVSVTYDYFHLLLAFLQSAGECTEGTYQDDGFG